MDKQAQAVEVHLIALGKGECFASKAPQTLAQSEVESLDVIGFSLLLGNGPMLADREFIAIAFPEVGVKPTKAIGGRNA